MGGKGSDDDERSEAPSCEGLSCIMQAGAWQRQAGNFSLAFENGISAGKVQMAIYWNWGNKSLVMKITWPLEMKMKFLENWLAHGENPENPENIPSKPSPSSPSSLAHREQQRQSTWLLEKAYMAGRAVACLKAFADGGKLVVSGSRPLNWLEGSLGTGGLTGKRRQGLHSSWWLQQHLRRCL